MRKTNKQNQRIAKRFGVTMRAVSGWKQQGAPLDSLPKLREWLTHRKFSPTETTGRKAKPVDGPGAGDDGPQAVGAPAALRRLERAEVSAYQRLQRAIATDDPITTKTARESWLKIAEALRHYERAVSQDQRERGELVSRVEVLNGLTLLGHVMRVASESQLHMVVDAFQSEMVKPQPCIITLRNILKATNYTVAMLTYGSLKSWKIPDWITDAVSQDLTNTTTVSRGDIARCVEAIEFFAQENAKRVIEAQMLLKPK